MSTHELSTMPSSGLSGKDMTAFEIEKAEDGAWEENKPGRGAEHVDLSVSAYSHLPAITIAKRMWRVPAYAAMAAVGALFDGIAITVPGSIIANAGFVAQFGTIVAADGSRALDPNHVGAWGGIGSAGQIVGMLVGPFVSDRFGRRIGMLALAIILGIAIVLEIVAKEWTVYLGAKLLTGVATGMVQSGITVYISEIATTQIRGALLSMYSLFFGMGQLAAAIAMKVVNDMGPAKFRHAFYCQFVFLGIFIPFVALLPESPWYYARKRQDTEAKRSMTRLYGNVANYDVDSEYKVLQASVSYFEALQAQQKTSKYVQLFKGVNGRRTFISFFPLAFQQFLGISLIFGYSTYFFQLAGLADPFVGSLIIQLILLVFIFVSFFTVERFGRRPSLLIGGGVMGLCTLFVGVVGRVAASSGTGLITLCSIWVTAYALSAGPIGWTYVAETSTPQLRAKTTGVAAAGTAALGLVFNYTVPIMLASPGANWGLNIGFFYSGLTFLALVALYFTIPETKARSYAELDELFTMRVSARKFASTQTSAEQRTAGQVEV